MTERVQTVQMRLAINWSFEAQKRCTCKALKKPSISRNGPIGAWLSEHVVSTVRKTQLRLPTFSDLQAAYDLRVVGGCCGTDHEYLGAIASACGGRIRGTRHGLS